MSENFKLTPGLLGCVKAFPKLGCWELFLSSLFLMLSSGACHVAHRLACAQPVLAGGPIIAPHAQQNGSGYSHPTAPGTRLWRNL